MKKTSIVAVLLVVLLAACSGRPGERSGPRNLITGQELSSVASADLYLAVQSLRPQWLRQMSRQSIYQNEQIWVYMDDLRLGGLDQLKQIMPASVESVQFLTGLEATQRWGLDHGHGAIVVKSRR
jgi:hypothetical protein